MEGMDSSRKMKLWWRFSHESGGETVNGLGKSFGLLLALCLLIVVIAVGVSVVYELLLKDVGEDEEAL